MREILFRGKANCEGRDNEWVYGGLLPETENTFPIIVRDYDNDEDWIGINGWETVAPETVGQYTGLTDKYGKKIFEGDIVKCIFISPYQEIEFVSEVVFLDGSWFVHENEDCDIYLYTYEIEGEGSLSEIEIIGNTHDNPELMKGGE